MGWASDVGRTRKQGERTGVDQVNRRGERDAKTVMQGWLDCELPGAQAEDWVGYLVLLIARACRGPQSLHPREWALFARMWEDMSPRHRQVCRERMGDRAEQVLEVVTDELQRIEGQTRGDVAVGPAEVL